MTIPRTYVVSSPFGELTGTCKQIVAAYNNIVETKHMDPKYRLAVSSFSRLVTGKNKSNRYKSIAMAKPWKRRTKQFLETALPPK